jgi:carbon storage regulator
MALPARAICPLDHRNGSGTVLVLTRQIGEIFNIGDDISVRVLGITGNQVRLGIDAPQHVRVHRTEIFRRIAASLRQHNGQSPRN